MKAVAGLGPGDVEPPLAAVAVAHRRLFAAIADLTDAQVAEPSLLPGWTRGHVLAHLADAARARARVVERAARGERVELWEPGERDAIIEATASRSAAEHRAATVEHASRLERAWAGVTDWSASADPDPVPPVFTRWREVWIHLVDLDVGVRPAEWSAEFAVHTIAVLRSRLPDGVALRATDVPRTWGTGTEVVGGVRDLAAWLAGRVPDAPPTCAVPLPELGPWPSYPARRQDLPD
ncbi:maleylpyruvate isomerase family mycothiol-dependent enzyme [Saccharothrix sp. S26]|uniref:maleylpyruvate isomerase family mycothiol-dependent enzyme n=1 Tax=Saccharothrix sp. S26 TaxID=2907215 RepID=UPI001F29244D|nr:maleylpyruvate isomerase family mycothiol-dependent enzyme [Saccharothrix sp. S26]MCE6995260.1 maleylpyruvate isomerase family mycothiol-dependent enzyme [Saccharothrix sp. S26]